MTALRYAIDALSSGSVTALVALGVALVFGIMGLANFAQGDLITSGAYSLVVTSGLPFAASVAIMLVTVVVLALLMERLAFRPLRNADPVTLLVASLAVSYLLENLDVMIFGANTRSVALPGFFSASFSGSLQLSHLEIVTLALSGGLLIALTLFLNRTSVGIQMLASASDFTMARLLGVRAHRMMALAFAISGVLAAAVAFVSVAQLGAFDSTLGLQPLLLGFAGVVIGGMGSLVGATLGGFILGALSVVLEAVLPVAGRSFSQAFLFAVVIIFLLLRPQGLVRGRAAMDRV